MAHKASKFVASAAVLSVIALLVILFARRDNIEVIQLALPERNLTITYRCTIDERNDAMERAEAAHKRIADETDYAFVFTEEMFHELVERDGIGQIEDVAERMRRGIEIVDEVAEAYTVRFKKVTSDIFREYDCYVRNLVSILNRRR
ncbi:MAG: hypothetical protein AAFV62_11520 [Pseudomonadota bacterium]